MASTVFELFGTIAINNRDANQSLEETSSKAERTGKRIQAAFKNIGAGALKIGKMVVGGATAIGTAFTATVEGTREYRTAMAKLETAFITNGHSAETATRTYKDLQAVLGETDQAVEAANHLAVMCENEKELYKWTDICTGVYATFGDSLPIEGLTESANETAKVGQVTGSLADALNWAGINEDEFNKKLSACTSEQERQDLIMNTLYWTYKSASEQYKETAGNVMKANTAQDNLNAALAKLGEIGEPIMTGLKTWVADMVIAAAPYLETLITKLANFDTTMETEVWPWLQKEAKMRFGVDLPDWETFKVNVETWWTDTKASIESWCRFSLAFVGILPWNEENQAALINWWDGVYAKIGEICTWKIPTPSELTEEDAQKVIESIQAWWDGIVSRLRLMIGITPQVQANYVTYQSGIEAASGGSAAASLLTENFISNPDAPWLTGLSTLFGSPDGSHAGGLDRVPYDGYIARVHKDESILTKEQADVWRGGGSAKMEALLAQIVNLLIAGQVIQLDSGIMAGQLTPAIDARLGVIQGYKERGN